MTYSGKFCKNLPKKKALISSFYKASAPDSRISPRVCQVSPELFPSPQAYPYISPTPQEYTRRKIPFFSRAWKLLLNNRQGFAGTAGSAFYFANCCARKLSSKWGEAINFTSRPYCIGKFCSAEEIVEYQLSWKTCRRPDALETFHLIHFFFIRSPEHFITFHQHKLNSACQWCANIKS